MLSDHELPPRTALASTDADLKEPEAFSLPANAEAQVFTPSLWQAVIPFCILAALTALALTLENSAPGTKPPFSQTRKTASPSNDGNYLPDVLETPAAQDNTATGPENLPVTPNSNNPAPLSSTQPVSSSASPLAGMPLTSAPLPASTPPPGSPGKTSFEAGESALRQRKLADAKRAFQQSLQQDDKLAPAHLRLAAIAATENNAKDAQFHLESAVRLLPNDAAPRLQLSELFMNLRQPQKAEVAAQDAVRVAKGPERRAAQAIYARLLMANRKEKQAYQQWTSLLKSHPNDAEAAFSASVIAEQSLHNAPDAQKWLAQASKTAPTNPEVAIGVARYLAGKKRLKEADTVLANTSRKFPTFIPLRLTWAELKMARGDDKSALADLRGLLSKVPASVAGGAAKTEVSVALSQALAHSGQTKAAVTEAKNALKLQPRNPAVVATVAEIFLSCGDTKSGIASLKTLLQLDPKNSRAHYVLAGAYADLKQWDAAQSELDNYVKARPDDLNAIAAKARLQEQRGDKSDALQTWAALAQKKPDEPFVAFQQARLLGDMQRFDEALEKYQAILKRMPKEPNALMGAAEIEEKRGDTRAALGHLKQFVVVEPKFDPAYAALGRVAKKQNQMAPTVEFLKTQLTKNPDRRGAYALILDYYDSLGKAEAGRVLVKSYIDKNPKLPAPRAAIDEFDLRRAKAELSGLLQADKAKAAKTSALKSDADDAKSEAEKSPFRTHGSTLPAPTP